MSAPLDKRIPFRQSEAWERRHRMLREDVYAEDRCCYCFLPVKADAARLALSRNNDGEWFAVVPNAPALPDESHMGRFSLPIGPDCLRRHPEFEFAAFVPIPATASTGAEEEEGAR